MLSNFGDLFPYFKDHNDFVSIDEKTAKRFSEYLESTTYRYGPQIGGTATIYRLNEEGLMTRTFYEDGLEATVLKSIANCKCYQGKYKSIKNDLMKFADSDEIDDAFDELGKKGLIRPSKIDKHGVYNFEITDAGEYLLKYKHISLKNK